MAFLYVIMADFGEGFVGSKNETTCYVGSVLKLVVRIARVAFSGANIGLFVADTGRTFAFFSDAR